MADLKHVNTDESIVVEVIELDGVEMLRLTDHGYWSGNYRSVEELADLTGIDLADLTAKEK